MANLDDAGLAKSATRPREGSSRDPLVVQHAQAVCGAQSAGTVAERSCDLNEVRQALRLHTSIGVYSLILARFMGFCGTGDDRSSFGGLNWSQSSPEPVEPPTILSDWAAWQWSARVG